MEFVLHKRKKNYFCSILIKHANIMTTQKNNGSGLCFILSISLSISTLFASCINGLPGEEEILVSGDIPVAINAIQNFASNFTTEENFKNEDKIGLYLTIPPSTLQNTRYIDNMCYTYSSSKGFTPDETVFFPEGNNACDFLAYYPYQKKGITKGNNGIEVKVPIDQSVFDEFSDFNFMVATTKGIKATETAIDLKFENKLFCYNFQLKVESGYTPESLLNANPEIKIKNVYTEATYDFSTNTFVNPSIKSDIIPFGTWTIKDEMLCGKSAIIIPQSLSQSHIIIELHVDDKIYECSYKKAYALESGKLEENTITLLSSSDASRIEIATSVNGWDTKQNNMEATERASTIQTANLDFTDSNILKVMHKDKQVAEICKEYLCGNGIDTTAIVIYPMANEKTDLTKGVVIEVEGKKEAIHGGSVSWDKATNQFTYTEGTSPALSYIYITTDGEIKTTRPVNALQLEWKASKLTDIRGGETIDYSMTKIGTQYWLKNNFKSLKYTDGTDIEAGNSTVNNNTAQIYNYSNAYFFYNATVIATGKLLPAGWRIGNETDYTKLKTYIKDKAAVLKNGTSWKTTSSGVTNLTGFNAAATGYFKPIYLYNREYAAYWCANSNNPNTVDKMVTLYTENNDIKIENATGEIALSIKCIRE